MSVIWHKRTSDHRPALGDVPPGQCQAPIVQTMFQRCLPYCRVEFDTCLASFSVSLRFFLGTPHACDFFGLAGNANVRAAKVLARLSAHTVHTSIGPFQTVFVTLPIVLRPVGRRLTGGLLGRSCTCHQDYRNERPQNLEPRSRELIRAYVFIGLKRHDLEPQLGLSSRRQTSRPSKALRVAACQTSPYPLSLASHWPLRPAFECFCRCSL